MEHKAFFLKKNKAENNTVTTHSDKRGIFQGALFRL